jgi:hypothetical protein
MAAYAVFVSISTTTSQTFAQTLCLGQDVETGFPAQTLLVLRRPVQSTPDRQRGRSSQQRWASVWWATFAVFTLRDFALISGLETAGLHENAALVLDRCLRVASDSF